MSNLWKFLEIPYTKAQMREKIHELDARQSLSENRIRDLELKMARTDATLSDVISMISKTRSYDTESAGKVTLTQLVALVVDGKPILVQRHVPIGIHPAALVNTDGAPQ